MFVFVPRSDEFKYFDEMPLGEVLTVRLVVSLVLLRRLCNDDLMASATPSTRFPTNFCYYCSNADNVQAVFFILFPPTTVHLRRLLAQQWGMCEVTMSCETCYQSSNAKEDHRGATPGASHRLDLEMLCTRLWAGVMTLVWEYENGGSEDVAVARPGMTFSLGHLEVAQVQGLLAGYAPVVGLLAHFVVLQSRLVVHGQPLNRVCGQRLQVHETTCSQKVHVRSSSAAFTPRNDTNCVCVCARALNLSLQVKKMCSEPLQYWFRHTLQVSAHLCQH